ncbi:hypothetical protein [Haloferula sargassicola]|uniref:Cadherin domain-containing protein n=1 Tax=Haloferula sargassicola TaxID=490096 RepID=A0ABP9ULK0_9BACT
MKQSLISAVVAGLSLSAASSQTLLWSDHFDVPDSAFDSAELTGRLDGLAAGETAMQSFGAQQQITNDQLDLAGIGGVRFGPEFNRYDWAGATTGPTILGSQGFVVTFDWSHDGSSSEWLAWKIGTPNNDSPVNAGDVNHAILIRQGPAGGGEIVERWNNGTNLGGTGLTYNPVAGTMTTYAVELRYTFNSFDDSSPVNVVALVDGTEIVNDNFTWTGHGGALRMEMQTGIDGNFIDNLAVTSLPEVPFALALDEKNFLSGEAVGTAIGTLTANLGVTPLNSTFTFVSGEGDADNGLFTIDGDQLKIGTDFTGTASSDQQVFSVRIQADSTEDGGRSVVKAFELTVGKDDDLDDLPDPWELRWAADLTVLDGTGSFDSDNDTLFDIEEYQLSIGEFPGYRAYPNINPTAADSDGDGVLSDLDELFPITLRPSTDPTELDTDFDGLSDVAETNTGIYVDENDTGTDPANNDYDGDGARDGWELDTLGSDAMYDPLVYPPSEAPQITVTRITDDASTSISATKVYTHAISGGSEAMVNGVTFEALTPALTPPDFSWTTINNQSRLSSPSNLGNWDSAAGGVTGPGIISLFEGLTWSGSGDGPGAKQTYTLSGLTPGEDYVVRVFIRKFGNNGIRPIDLSFINGTDVVTPYLALPEDLPSLILGSTNNDEAYYLSYPYTAQGTELVIEAALHPGVPALSGSFHLYGLSNEVEGAVAALPPAIVSVAAAASGDVTIDFTGAPSTSYSVTKSPDLESGFGPLASPLNPMTDGGGSGQVVVPASEFGGAGRYFLRIEE